MDLDEMESLLCFFHLKKERISTMDEKTKFLNAIAQRFPKASWTRFG